MVNKFKATGVVSNIERSIHRRFARCAENIAVVSESVATDSNVSIPRRSQELGLSDGTLWHILHLDLYLLTYKVQLTHQQKPADHSQHRRYMERVLPFFELHFALGRYVNKQNCRIWSSEDPQVIDERSLHTEKVTVRCALWSAVVIGPYFFENDSSIRSILVI